MATFAKHIISCNTNTALQHPKDHHLRPWHINIRSSQSPTPPTTTTRRWAILSTILASSSPVVLRTQPARSEGWGTHSFIKEKYFQPEISPEEAVARIRQTAEGLKDMRHMLDTMSWKYVMFYVRLKSAYLDSDLKNAMATVPEAGRQSYIKVANEVVDNMSELDRYIRTPKVYESYLYYEKTLKSLDDLVAMFA